MRLLANLSLCGSLPTYLKVLIWALARPIAKHLLALLVNAVDFSGMCLVRVGDLMVVMQLPWLVQQTLPMTFTAHTNDTPC